MIWESVRGGVSKIDRSVTLTVMTYFILSNFRREDYLIGSTQKIPRYHNFVSIKRICGSKISISVHTGVRLVCPGHVEIKNFHFLPKNDLTRIHVVIICTKSTRTSDSSRVLIQTAMKGEVFLWIPTQDKENFQNRNY